jgi:hypothetical protein
LGDEQGFQAFKDKGIQTQYEVKFLCSQISIVESPQGLDMAQFIAFKWN